MAPAEPLEVAWVVRPALAERLHVVEFQGLTGWRDQARLAAGHAVAAALAAVHGGEHGGREVAGREAACHWNTPAASLRIKRAVRYHSDTSRWCSSGVSSCALDHTSGRSQGSRASRRAIGTNPLITAVANEAHKCAMPCVLVLFADRADSLVVGRAGALDCLPAHGLEALRLMLGAHVSCSPCSPTNRTAATNARPSSSSAASSRWRSLALAGEDLLRALQQHGVAEALLLRDVLLGDVAPTGGGEGRGLRGGQVRHAGAEQLAGGRGR